MSISLAYLAKHIFHKLFNIHKSPPPPTNKIQNKIKKIQKIKKIKKLRRRRKSYNYLLLNLIEDEREKMATMKIPMTVPSPRVDAEQLFKAFKGIIFNGYKQGFLITF